MGRYTCLNSLSSNSSTSSSTPSNSASSTSSKLSQAFKALTTTPPPSPIYYTRAERVYMSKRSDKARLRRLKEGRSSASAEAGSRSYRDTGNRKSRTSRFSQDAPDRGCWEERKYKARDEISGQSYRPQNSRYSIFSTASKVRHLSSISGEAANQEELDTVDEMYSPHNNPHMASERYSLHSAAESRYSLFDTTSPSRFLRPSSYASSTCRSKREIMSDAKEEEQDFGALQGATRRDDHSGYGSGGARGFKPPYCNGGYGRISSREAFRGKGDGREKEEPSMSRFSWSDSDDEDERPLKYFLGFLRGGRK